MMIQNFHNDVGGLAAKAEDSYAFESILNRTIEHLADTILNGGISKDEKGVWLGTIKLTRWPGEETGIASIEYTPSSPYAEKLGYKNKIIGTLNLRTMKYDPLWDNEDVTDVPAQMQTMADYIILNYLGFSKQKPNPLASRY